MKRKIISVLLSMTLMGLAASSTCLADTATYKANTKTPQERKSQRLYYGALLKSEIVATKKAGAKYDSSTQRIEYIGEMLRLQKESRISLQKEYNIDENDHIHIIYDGAFGIL